MVHEVAAGSRLTDLVSLGVLASSVERDAVDEAIRVTGCGARRSDGKLPPHVMVYFTMALALFATELSPTATEETPEAVLLNP